MKLEIIEHRVELTRNKKYKHKYRCYCGSTFISIGADVNSGRVVSCGCYNSKILKQRMTTHGLSKTKEHRAWLEMKRRCFNPDRPGYQNYGGRGITICSQWINNFEQFLADVGYKPDDSYSLDRIDNDGNYEPGNVRWADRKTQSRNQRRHKDKVFEK